MEVRLRQRRDNLREKIPEIKRTVQAIEFLQEKEEEAITTHFPLADNIYVEAEVQKTGTCGLWLGVCNSTLNTFCCSLLFCRQM